MDVVDLKPHGDEVDSVVPILRESPVAPPGHRGAEHYERYVAPFTAGYTGATMRGLDGHSPQRILDLGAGTGVLTRQLQQAFPAARILALDPSEGMLSQLTALLGPGSRVATRAGTAADLQPEDRFDACVSQLALMFVDDPEVDLRLLRGRAEPGSPLVVTVLGGRSDVIAFERYWSAAQRTDDRLAGPEEYPHFRFGDPTALIDGALAAGWADVRCERVLVHHEMDVDELWPWLWGAMPLRRRGSGGPAVLDAIGHARLRDELERTTEDLAVGDGRLRIPMHGWCLRAQAT